MEGEQARRAFGDYFTARRDAIRRLAYLLCGDWHWADDLTQMAFVRLAAGWERIRDSGARDAFLRTCLVRAYLSETRRLWRRREMPYAEPAEPTGTAGDDEAERSASRLAFAAALGRLPPRQRATLVCRFYQELDVQATAVALGCSTGTVKSQTARGLAALRELLGDLAVQPMRPPAAMNGVRAPVVVEVEP